MAGFNFDLLDQLSFYGAYHTHPINKLIHLVCVPLLWWTGAVWFCYTGPILPIQLPKPLDYYFEPNAALIAYLVYALYYLALDFKAALLADGVLTVLIMTANAFVHEHHDKAWMYALGLHVFGWYMQIHPGHRVFEGNTPALLDSFFQSLVLAPLFVFYEVLFVLGFRKDLQRSLEQRIKDKQAAIRRKSSGKKRA